MSGQSIDPKILSQLIPVGGLKPQGQKELLAKANVKTFAAAEDLFRHGDAKDISMYVLSGSVLLEDANGKPLRTVTAGTDAAKHRLAHQIPRIVTARASSDATILSFDTEVLDVMLTWDQTGRFEVGELSSDGDDDVDWMTRLLRMQIFQQVPPSSLQTLLMKMQPINVNAGDVVLKQGEPGDYFYVINDTRAIVTRESPSHAKPVKLAELGPGSCFGEDALISDDPRNASVTVLAAGTLMRLSKSDFRSLLHDPTTQSLSMDEARTMMQTRGGVLVDVRLPSEYQAGHHPEAINLPLYLLRMRLRSMNTDVPYIVACQTGRRSAVAAFVMNEQGYEAYVLGDSATPSV